MERKLILGLDIGSSSVRGALFDAHGRMLSGTLVRNERKLTATRGGGAELNPEKAFLDVASVIDTILEHAESIKGEITHIASCAFWHSLIGIDGKGRPTTPVYGWADTQSREYVSVLRKKFDETRLHNRTGCRFHSSYWPAKLLWLKKERPDAWKRTEKWISFSDYVALKLCGTTATTISMASGTGFFDIRDLKWDAELLRYLKIKEKGVPEIISSEKETFPLLPKWKNRWPQLIDARFSPSIADGAANNIGSNCTVKDRAALMVGTSGALRVVFTGEPPKTIPSGLFCYRVDRKRVVLGGALSDGGGLYDWLKQNLRIDIPDSVIGKATTRRGPVAHGIIFLPFLAGERSTGYNENAFGAILGLSMANDGIDIIQAAMEAVAYRFSEILNQIETVSPVREIIASGGSLTQSAVWAKIIANVLGRDLTLSNEPEASLRGAVLLTLSTTGKINLTDEFSAKRNKKVSFHPKLHAIYKEARKKHQNAYEATYIPINDNCN